MSANRTEFSFSDAELLTLSAALQVYHDVAAEFGKDVWVHHADEFPENVSAQMEEDLIELINRVNVPLVEKYPVEDWQEQMDAMPEKERRVAILGTHAAHGAKQFAELTLNLMENIVIHMDARNN